jgi:rSAM/selenodomain-associated transferase 1
MSCELILFCKAPEPGQVKTRLSPPLSPQQAADLYEAFTRDLIERIAAHGAFRLILSADPGPDHPFFTELAAASGASGVPQGNGDLGELMARALHGRLTAGVDKALLIGTDMPTVPMAHLDEAARLLDEAPVVFGPSADGGYYLAGAAARALDDWDAITARLFSAEIPWSTPDALRATLARKGEIEVALAPPWHDVDVPADLERLCAHLKDPAGTDLPRTRRLLAAWGRL